MIAYFDSSLLLSILTGDPQVALGVSLWRQYEDRVSSYLLEIESLIVLRRLSLQNKKIYSTSWLQEGEDRLGHYLEEISLKPVDSAILEIIRTEKKLSGCRALDAIHLATALFFRVAADQEFSFCTFDKDLGAQAKQFGFSVNSDD